MMPTMPASLFDDAPERQSAHGAVLGVFQPRPQRHRRRPLAPDAVDDLGGELQAANDALAKDCPVLLEMLAERGLDLSKRLPQLARWQAGRGLQLRP